ncbi:MAG TPA: hypothetical protein PK031_09735, partial [Pseudomonadales bacterium]|nr:hypothetical protein [Pseudomonadales bacterium]
TCTVLITPGSLSTLSPHQVQQQKREQQQVDAEMSFKNDPNVIALLQQFDGEIVTGSVTPFNKSIH